MLPRFKKVDLGKTEDSKKVAVQKNFGRLAVVGDEHSEPYYHMGKLMKHNFSESYRLSEGNDKSRLFLYHDLTMLLVEFP